MSQDFLRLAVDIILVGVIAEAVVLMGMLVKRGSRTAAELLFLFLASGLCLLAATRLALSDGSALAIGAALLFGGLLHAAFLWRAAALTTGGRRFADR